MKIIRLLTIGAGVAFFSAAPLNSRAADATLPGHVPAVVPHLRPAGQLPAGNNLDLALGLPLRNQAALTNLMEDSMIRPARIITIFSPRPIYRAIRADGSGLSDLIDFARANGLAVTQTHGNRVLLDVRGNVSDIENTFHVRLRTYRHPKETREFFAPDTEPSVAGGLPVLDISGLNDYALPRPLSHLGRFPRRVANWVPRRAAVTSAAISAAPMCRDVR